MSKFGIPTDEQLAKINKLAKRNLSKDEVFVFPSKLAGDMIIPNRFIQLQKELLDVYATDAKKGVSLLLDHSWSPDGFFGMGGRPKAAIPYGRTFDSRYETSTEEGETISLVADHYMLKGVEIDGIKTDDLAISIEAGTLFDTSIGFGFDKATCSVCDKDYRRCSHYAGRTYEIEGEDEVVRNKLCYIKAEPPGYLMENSLVFDGAYPGAGVLSNAGDVGENENGVFEVVSDLKNLDPDKTILSLYNNNRGITTLVKKSDHQKIFSTGGFTKQPIIITKDSPEYRQSILGIKDGKLKGSEGNMNEKVLEVLNSLGIEYKEGETKAEDILGEIGEKFQPAIDEALQVVRDEFEGRLTDEPMTGIVLLEENVTEKLGSGEFTADKVLDLAKEGQSYHKTLSEEAITAGVRAMGNDFAKETWERTFANMDTKSIMDIKKSWDMQVKDEIPEGRLSDPKPGKKAVDNIPDEAYKI